MTSTEWMRNAGRAEKRKLEELAAAEDNRKRDEAAVDKLEPGDTVEWRDGDETRRGFVAEIHLDRGEVAVENWNHAATLPARKVEKVE